MSESNSWNIFTFVYGEPRAESCHLMWNTLRRLKGISDLPWLVLGDFNETLWEYEHFSDTPRPERQMEKFRDMLSVCDLHDLGFCGLPYTWDNGRSGNANVLVRLDRAVADPEWRDIYSDARVHHLISSRSDHCPVLVELRKDAWERSSTRIFCYEIMWERVDSFSDEIRKVWCSSVDRGNLHGLVSVLQNMQMVLRQWSKEHFGAVTGELNALRCELEDVKSRTVVCRADIRAITNRMDELFKSGGDDVVAVVQNILA